MMDIPVSLFRHPLYTTGEVIEILRCINGIRPSEEDKDKINWIVSAKCALLDLVVRIGRIRSQSCDRFWGIITIERKYSEK